MVFYNNSLFSIQVKIKLYWYIIKQKLFYNNNITNDYESTTIFLNLTYIHVEKIGF